MTEEPSPLTEQLTCGYGALAKQFAEAYERAAQRAIEAHGLLAMTPSLTALMTSLDAEGTRISTLAQRAGLTKQGMGQIVKEAEDAEIVCRIPDPDDGRATLILITDRGRALLSSWAAITRDLDARAEALLGEIATPSFRLGIERLAHGFDPQPEGEGASRS